MSTTPEYTEHNETCWLGGECENPVDYDITHGYEGIYKKTHGICKSHIAEAVWNLNCPVSGWGEALPLIAVRRKKETVK